MEKLTQSERSQIALEELTKAHNELAETPFEGSNSALVKNSLERSEHYKNMIIEILYKNIYN